MDIGDLGSTCFSAKNRASILEGEDGLLVLSLYQDAQKQREAKRCLGELHQLRRSPENQFEVVRAGDFYLFLWDDTLNGVSICVTSGKRCKRDITVNILSIDYGDHHFLSSMDMSGSENPGTLPYFRLSSRPCIGLMVGRYILTSTIIFLWSTKNRI